MEDLVTKYISSYHIMTCLKGGYGENAWVPFKKVVLYRRDTEVPGPEGTPEKDLSGW